MKLMSYERCSLGTSRRLNKGQSGQLRAHKDRFDGLSIRWRHRYNLGVVMRLPNKFAGPRQQ
jgi:hypothetical protein